MLSLFSSRENDVLNAFTSKRPPKNSLVHPKKHTKKCTQKNDTKTHINTLFEETCTRRKKPEEHDGFII